MRKWATLCATAKVNKLFERSLLVVVMLQRRRQQDHLYVCCSSLNAKSCGRLACLYQSLLMGSLVMGSLWIFALFPQTTAEYFPVISRVGLYSRSPSPTHYATYYCLASSIFWTLPYVLVSICGTRSYCLVVCCGLSNVVIFLHFAMLWISALLCGLNYPLQIIVTSLLVVSQIIVSLVLSCTLQTRIRESDNMHTVQLIHQNM